MLHRHFSRLLPLRRSKVLHSPSSATRILLGISGLGALYSFSTLNTIYLDDLPENSPVSNTDRRFAEQTPLSFRHFGYGISRVDYQMMPRYALHPSRPP